MADPYSSWHSNGAYFDGAVPRQPMPFPRRHSRNASVDNLAYQPVYPSSTPSSSTRHSRSNFAPQDVSFNEIPFDFGDVGIPIVPAREPPPVVHARPYLVNYGPEPVPRQRNGPMSRSNSVQFRELDYPPAYNPPPLRPLTRTKTLPPPPPPSPLRLPPPYRPPPEPPGRPSAPKPKPIEQPSPPQAPPRRRHSQGGTLEQEEEVKISVRDRKKLFDSFSSENLLAPSPVKEEEVEPPGRLFTLACAVNDLDKILSFLKDFPVLNQWRDPVTGYCSIHWAARKGNLDVIRALSLCEGFDVNARTAGGYTGLHLAAQFNHDEVFELLVGKFGADASLRDYSGKKPHQYRQKQAASISISALNRIQLRKTQHQQQQERDPKLLRLGSINVRVKKTAEALNQMIGKTHSSPSSKRPHSVFTIPTSSSSQSLRGSTKSLASDSSGPDDKVARRFSSVDASESSRIVGNGSFGRKNQLKRVVFGEEAEEDDSACGFGTEWQA